MRAYTLADIKEPHSRSALAEMERRTRSSVMDSTTAFEMAAGARAAQIRHREDKRVRPKVNSVPHNSPTAKRVIACRGDERHEFTSMRKAAAGIGCPRGNMWEQMKIGRYKDWELRFAS